MADLKRSFDKADADLAFADKVIKAANIKQINPLPIAPRHNEQTAQTQCQKCSKWINDEEFHYHWDLCPWICGLCGIRSYTEKEAHDHAWRCTMNNLDKDDQ